VPCAAMHVDADSSLGTAAPKLVSCETGAHAYFRCPSNQGLAQLVPKFSLVKSIDSNSLN